MSRKHYEAVARVLNDRSAHDHPVAVMERKQIADSLADVFAQDNIAFDYDRFMTACGF